MANPNDVAEANKQTDVVRRESPNLREAASAQTPWQAVSSISTLPGIVLIVAFSCLCLLLGAALGWVTTFGAIIFGLLICGFGWLIGQRAESKIDNDASAAAWIADDGVQRPEFAVDRVVRYFIEDLKDAMIVVDKDGRIIGANASARQRFVGEDPIGKSLTNVLRQPEVIEAVEKARVESSDRHVDYSDLVPVERHLAAHVSPISHLPNHPGSVAILIRDLTAEKRGEQMRADFVANASHELRTPLSSLTGFIETLLGHAKDDPEARDRFLQIMQEQAQRMGRLIDDLLSLSRIELNEHVPPSDRIDLKDIISEVVNMLKPQIAEDDVTIAIDAPEGAVNAIGDRDELVQIFQNLIDNAIKYGHAGGKVDIEIGRLGDGGLAEVEGDTTFVRVSDYGRGIAREHVPRLTERFYRVNVQDSREKGGTGLGLAIVKHIVSRHRGKLLIKSALNEGSTFTVMLPATAP